MYDNEFETKENKISTKHKMEPQHIHPLTQTSLINAVCVYHLNSFGFDLQTF